MLSRPVPLGAWKSLEHALGEPEVSEAASILLHTGLVLTATGVSRCIELEAYAAATIAPAVFGVGAAIAVEIPVKVEACGLGRVAMTEDIDYKVKGHGIVYSTPGLVDALSWLAIEACREGNDAVGDLIQRLSGEAFYPYEAVVASLRGSTLVVDNNVFPLDALNGYWAVVVKLRRRIDMSRALLALVERPTLREKLFSLTEGDVEALRDIGLEMAAAVGRRAAGIVRRVVKMGADAALLDASGSLLIVVTSEPVKAWSISPRLRSLGYRYEAPIVA